MHDRLKLTAGTLVICFALLLLYLILLMRGANFVETAIRQSQTTVLAGSAGGTIYDRNFQPLVNGKTCHYAAAPPTPETVAAILPHVLEVSPLLEGIRTGEPFVCKIGTDAIDCEGVTVLDVPERDSDGLARHVLGYTLEGVGITGLEGDYDTVLREMDDTASVSYTVDARGNVLPGVPPQVTAIEGKNTSLVTTLDKDIQAICEAQPIDKGAVVVMDVHTGDILAMASFPTYDPESLGDAISDENAPLIDRCLCPYNVGSIFKLMTCAAAYRQGMTHFQTVCTGETEVEGQVFRCHDWNGHGLLDMKHAMIYSCNAYFVDMSRHLDPLKMRSLAQDFGFGTQFALTKSIISQSGTLPTTDDLALPAEMANFCFGQGKLTATPLQVAQMTCGIAGNGNMPIARLIRGFSSDGAQIVGEQTPRYARVLRRNEAYYLQDMMIAAINENENSNAVPETVHAAAKTSTAQTGRYDENEVELCHAWITGYFPLDDPQYAVTVLAEDAGYGNDAAAPVFRDIADGIWRMRGEA